jgi:hypothetical protein
MSYKPVVGRSSRHSLTPSTRTTATNVTYGITEQNRNRAEYNKIHEKFIFESETYPAAY